MKRIQNYLASFTLLLGMGVAMTTPVGAVNVFDNCNGNNSKTAVCNAKNKDNVNSMVQAIVGILLWAVGLISVLMIIVGAIRFALSAGDASQTKSARETIIYAVVGLVVALLSFAIVKFVLKWF